MPDLTAITQHLTNLGNDLATLLDGLVALREALRDTGRADVVDVDHLVGMACDIGDHVCRFELAQAEALAATLAQVAIRRAASGGAA